MHDASIARSNFWHACEQLASSKAALHEFNVVRVKQFDEKPLILLSAHANA